MAEPAQADLFRVPLLDGSDGIGQVIEIGEDGLFVLLSSDRHGDAGSVPVPLSRVLALLRIPADPLASGQWGITGFDMIPETRKIWPHDLFWPDLPLTDPAIVEAFLSACHGLFPWDGFPDEGLFDRMLAAGRDRPAQAVLGSG